MSRAQPGETMSSRFGTSLDGAAWPSAFSRRAGCSASASPWPDAAPGRSRHRRKIHFANGRIQDVGLRDVIPAGGESRVIDLVGGDRVIQHVEFWYDAQTRRRGRGARVLVFGRR